MKKTYFYIIFIWIFLLTGLFATEIQRLSLIIGNNYGLYNDTPLKYASRDAEKIYEVLAELGGIKSSRNYILLNQKKQKILESFYEIKGRVKEIKNNNQDVFLLIFYSGHAAPENLHIEGEKLSIKEVKDFFNTINADLKIMIVDACYSGSLLREKGIKIGAPIDITIHDQLETRGSAIISSSSDELAHESEELQGSLFTHYWISALRGAADFNNDKTITLLEAYNYAHSQTLRKINQTRGTKQQPAFDIDLVGQKDVILTNIEKGKAIIRFIKCDGKNYSIISIRTHNVLAEVSPTHNEVLSIAVPKDNYIIQKKTNKYLHVKNIDLTWKEDYEFTPNQLKMYPLESVIKKGKYYWHFMPYNILLRMKTRKDIITGSTQLFYPQLMFKYDYRKYIINAFIEYFD